MLASGLIPMALEGGDTIEREVYKPRTQALPSFSTCSTLKSWEWPGDEARKYTGCIV